MPKWVGDNMSKAFQTSLKISLNMLRALKYVAWNAHWMSRGPNFYGDHLLFEKIYIGDDDDSIDNLIDTLAEKMVFLKINVNCPSTFEDIYVASIRSFMDHQDDLPKSVLGIVYECLQALKYAYEIGKRDNAMSLGMDDYLMATSNHIETYAYLLQQRVNGWLR